MKKALVIWLILLACPLLGLTQSSPTAYEAHSALQVGGEFSAFNPDFYCTSSSPFSCGNKIDLLKGVGVFADYNKGTRLGVEGEARWLHWDGNLGQTESTYLVGPRVRAFTFHSLSAWGKILIGGGTISLPKYPRAHGIGTLLVYAPGGSLDYQVTRRLSLRGDYELQRWPNFSVGAPHNHGLSPSGFSVGVAYKVFGR